MPGLLAPLPKPRMMKLVLVEVCSCVTRSDGTSEARSATSRTAARVIVSPVVTVTATGTSCSVCSRLVAVTTTSSSCTPFCATAWVVRSVIATASPTIENDFIFESPFVEILRGRRKPAVDRIIVSTPILTTKPVGMAQQLQISDFGGGGGRRPTAGPRRGPRLAPGSPLRRSIRCIYGAGPADPSCR